MEHGAHRIWVRNTEEDVTPETVMIEMQELHRRERNSREDSGTSSYGAGLLRSGYGADGNMRRSPLRGRHDEDITQERHVRFSENTTDDGNVILNVANAMQHPNDVSLFVHDFGEHRDSVEEPDECCCDPELCFSSSEPEPFLFRRYSLVLAAVGFFVHYVDMMTDVVMAIRYFREEQWLYAGVTLGIVLAAYLFVGAMVFYSWMSFAKGISSLVKFTLGVLLVLFAPACHHFCTMISTFSKACASRSRRISAEERHKLAQQAREESTVSVQFRLMSVYIQSAPQLLWQLYIWLVSKPQLNGGFILTVLSSLVNLALMQAVYIDTERNNSGNRTVMNRSGQVISFLWRAIQTGGRSLCLVLFASLFHWWILAIVFPHWLFISLWLFHKLDPLQYDFPHRMLSSMANAYFSIFSHFACLTIHPSRYWYGVQYVVSAVENSLMVFLWFAYSTDQDYDDSFRLWCLIIGLWHGLPQFLLQWAFFKCFHPSSTYLSVGPSLNWRVWKYHLCDSTWS